VYCASKAAVLSLTPSFAHAYAARGVRVNAVCPGLVDTPVNDVVLAGIAPLRGVELAEYGRSRLEAVPLSRLADPREVAEVIAFLLSDASLYMTGQTTGSAPASVTTARPDVVAVGRDDVRAALEQQERRCAPRYRWPHP
jgi:NAD(P)-dependent dehydrogenase (short-subunit alcohol dehydrogenase family)